jgi:hypothetical protein
VLEQIPTLDGYLIPKALRHSAMHKACDKQDHIVAEIPLALDEDILEVAAMVFSMRPLNHYIEADDHKWAQHIAHPAKNVVTLQKLDSRVLLLM